jgi:hypothetical protein
VDSTFSAARRRQPPARRRIDPHDTCAAGLNHPSGLLPSSRGLDPPCRSQPLQYGNGFRWSHRVADGLRVGRHSNESELRDRAGGPARTTLAIKPGSCGEMMNVSRPRSLRIARPRRIRSDTTFPNG